MYFRVLSAEEQGGFVRACGLVYRLEKALVVSRTKF
jgi:hypothetical protein